MTARKWVGFACLVCVALSLSAAIIGVKDAAFLGGNRAAGIPMDMLLWLKGDAITGYTNGQNLSNWVDSGPYSMSVTQGTDANRPRYATNLVNGKAAVYFNATNGNCFNLPQMFTNQNAAELFVVSKLTYDRPAIGAQSGQWNFAGVANVGSENAYPFTSLKIFDGFASTTRKFVGTPSPLFTTWHLYNTSSTNDSWIARFNGMEMFATTVNVFTNGAQGTVNGTRRLGQSGAGSANLNGHIAEVLLYGRILSGTERTNVHNYFATKYAITNFYTSDWANRVVLNGGAVPSANSISAVEGFWTGIVNAHIYTNMIAACALAPDSLIAATTPVIRGNGHLLWTNGGGNFVIGDLTVNGLIGDETSKYLQTGVIASGNLTATSGGISIIVSDGTNQPASSGCDIGVVEGSSLFNHQRDSTTGQYADCWGAAVGERIIGTLSYGAQGAFFSVNRTASNALTNYWASQSQAFSVLVGTSVAQTVVTLPTIQLNAFAFNTTTVPSFYTGHRLSFIAVHAGLTQVNASNLWYLASNMRTNLGGGNPQ